MGPHSPQHIGGVGGDARDQRRLSVREETLQGKRSRGGRTKEQLTEAKAEGEGSMVCVCVCVCASVCMCVFGIKST